MENKEITRKAEKVGGFLENIWGKFKEHPVKFGCFTYIIISLIVAPFFFIGESIDKSEKESKIESCKQDKYEELKKQDKDAPKNYKEAMQQNNFVAARLYASCDDSWDSEGKIEEINKAEITSLLRQNRFDKARGLATEYKLTDYYQTNVQDMVFPQLLEENDFESCLSLLTNWYFSATPNVQASSCKESKINSINGDYNKEVDKFNDMVDKVLQKALLKRDRNNAKNCLNLYKDNLVVAKKVEVNKEETEKSKDKSIFREKEYEYFYDVTFKWESTAKSRAEKKIKETFR